MWTLVNIFLFLFVFHHHLNVNAASIRISSGSVLSYGETQPSNWALNDSEVIIEKNATLIIHGNHSFGSLTILDGGRILVTPFSAYIPNSGWIKIYAKNTVNISEGGMIDATGAGYGGGGGGGAGCYECVPGIGGVSFGGGGAGGAGGFASGSASYCYNYAISGAVATGGGQSAPTLPAPDCPGDHNGTYGGNGNVIGIGSQFVPLVEFMDSRGLSGGGGGGGGLWGGNGGGGDLCAINSDPSAAAVECSGKNGGLNAVNANTVDPIKGVFKLFLGSGGGGGAGGKCASETAGPNAEGPNGGRGGQMTSNRISSFAGSGCGGPGGGAGGGAIFISSPTLIVDGSIIANGTAGGSIAISITVSGTTATKIIRGGDGAAGTIVLHTNHLLFQTASARIAAASPSQNIGGIIRILSWQSTPALSMVQQYLSTLRSYVVKVPFIEGGYYISDADAVQPINASLNGRDVIILPGASTSASGALHLGSLFVAPNASMIVDPFDNRYANTGMINLATETITVAEGAIITGTGRGYGGGGGGGAGCYECVPGIGGASFGGGGAGGAGGFATGSPSYCYHNALSGAVATGGGQSAPTLPTPTCPGNNNGTSGGGGNGIGVGGFFIPLLHGLSGQDGSGGGGGGGGPFGGNGGGGFFCAKSTFSNESSIACSGSDGGYDAIGSITNNALTGVLRLGSGGGGAAGGTCGATPEINGPDAFGVNGGKGGKTSSQKLSSFAGAGCGGPGGGAGGAVLRIQSKTVILDGTIESSGTSGASALFKVPVNGVATVITVRGGHGSGGGISIWGEHLDIGANGRVIADGSPVGGVAQLQFFTSSASITVVENAVIAAKKSIKIEPAPTTTTTTTTTSATTSTSTATTATSTSTAATTSTSTTATTTTTNGGSTTTSSSTTTNSGLSTTTSATTSSTSTVSTTTTMKPSASIRITPSLALSLFIVGVAAAFRF